MHAHSLLRWPCVCWQHVKSLTPHPPWSSVPASASERVWRTNKWTLIVDALILVVTAVVVLGIIPPITHTHKSTATLHFVHFNDIKKLLFTKKCWLRRSIHSCIIHTLSPAFRPHCFCKCDMFLMVHTHVNFHKCYKADRAIVNYLHMNRWKLDSNTDWWTSVSRHREKDERRQKHKQQECERKNT